MLEVLGLALLEELPAAMVPVDILMPPHVSEEGPPAPWSKPEGLAALAARAALNRRCAA